MSKTVNQCSEPESNNPDLLVCGERTKELRGVFRRFCNADYELRVERIREAFHAMDIYPTKSQVYEMLECASQCNHSNDTTAITTGTEPGVVGSADETDPEQRQRQRPASSSRHSRVSELTRPYVTFGEFCIFASQLRRQYQAGNAKPVMMSKVYEKTVLEQKRKQRAVFLGGSCNPTTWRADVVIPVLKDNHITYYNPQVTNWVPEMIELEDQAKQAAQLLFFVIDNQTRSVASIVEAAYLIGCGRSVILVVRPWSPNGDNFVFDERITHKEYESLMRGQAFLHDVSEWSECPVFDSIDVALSCVIKIIKAAAPTGTCSSANAAQPTIS